MLLDHQAPSPLVAHDHRVTALGAAIALLPDEERLVLSLRFNDELTEAETAAVLDWSVARVVATADRALFQLRDHLRGVEPHVC